MKLLKEKDVQQLRELFAALTRPVRLVLLTRAEDGEPGDVTRALAEELVALSGHLSLEVHDADREPEVMQRHGLDKTPALVPLGERDHGIRFYGVPAGYELTSLVEDILDVGGRGHGLPGAVLAELARVDRPVRLEVFVTPTWPYCPRAVRTAHRFAQASEHITADMVEATEFPELARRYQVSGVPKTLIDGGHGFTGSRPEIEVARALARALAGSA